MSDSGLPGPCSIRQHMYMFPEKYAKDAEGNPLKISNIDVILYGGGAGGGKSEIAAIDFLRYTDIKNFIGVISRRTNPQMKGPGGMLSKCKRVFSKAYGPDEFVWREKDGKFIFHKSGAEIYLKHFENELAADNWQGVEANLITLDEGTQFSQNMVQYIMSRMRNPNCPEVAPTLKITCNPDADHFLAKWVDAYLDEEGKPDRDKDGWVRFFTFFSGEFIWGNTREEVARIAGVGVEDTLSFTFISATVDDNPILQKVNPKYVTWLKGLTGVERQRLLEGNWKVREQASTYFNREWVEEIDYLDESEVEATVRTFDFAGTLVSDINRSPDYTASVRMRRLKDGTYIIDDVKRTRIRPGDWLKFVVECCVDDPENTVVYIPEDPGVAGKRATMMFIRDLAEIGIYARKIRTHRSKLERFRPFSAIAQNEGLKFLSNCGTDYENNIYNDLGFVYRELEAFTGMRRRGEEFHDDVCRLKISLIQGTSLELTVPSQYSDVLVAFLIKTVW